jgi:hypothetical protein
VILDHQINKFGGSSALSLIGFGVVQKCKTLWVSPQTCNPNFGQKISKPEIHQKDKFSALLRGIIIDF